MPLGPKKLALLKELLKDARVCPRLSSFEETFVRDMATRLADYGDRIMVSEKQEGVLKQIEAKVYAT